jgi:toluene monooxygenase system ferredoxin subunit
VNTQEPTLAYFITNPDWGLQPDDRWLVLGAEAEKLATMLHTAGGQPANGHTPNTLVLAGALSAQANPWAWLNQTIAGFQNGPKLIFVDWQTDGPLIPGPALARRVKPGRLRRWLREAGFGLIETVQNHPIYYIVKAQKAAPAAAGGAFVPVATLDELPRNGMKAVEVAGQPVVVANTGKEIVAFARACPHANRHLDDGLLRGRNVICRAHGYIWNVCTGEPVEPPNEDTLPRYEVKIEPERGLVLVAPVLLNGLEGGELT